MSLLIEFYSGTRPDDLGRTLAQIQGYNASELEFDFHYIQRLFPLPEASEHDSAAPLLTLEDMQAFRASPELKDNVRKSFEMVADYFGFALTDTGVERHRWFEQCAGWVEPGHFNLLRATRMIRSMALLGLTNEARQFERALEEVYFERGVGIIPPETLVIWRYALDQPERRIGPDALRRGTGPAPAPG